MLFRLHLARVPVTIDSDLAAEDAQGARAWIIDSQGFDSAWLLRRLQRMGWAVTRLNSCAEAADRVGRVMAQGRGPSLVVVVEDHTALRSTAASLHLLRTQLPESAKLVLAVLADSPTLRHVELPGIDICVYPFSPGELTEYTRNVSPSTAGPDTQFGQLSGASASRRSVLVVDDNEVNRIVACGLIEALGYEVTTASDGLDAIERCRHAAPNVVLMDLDMNVLGGVEATRRLRELQRAGRLAPFSILACTAQSEAQARALSNDAGMDGYLSKPLNLGALRDELNRVAGLR